jgi:hypothetical protein
MLYDGVDDPDDPLPQGPQEDVTLVPMDRRVETGCIECKAENREESRE